METRPVWAEINLDHLAHNIQEVRRVTSQAAQVCAVIKADGYGHGAVQIAKTLLENGADRFAVATLSEAIQLRKHFSQVPILVLGYTPEENAAQVLTYDLTQTIWDLEQAKGFHLAAKQMERVAKVHLKVDSGMSRVGFSVNPRGIADALGCFQLNGLDIEGVYTHFACADEKDKTITHQQVRTYLEMVNEIELAGYKIPIKHVSNSAAIIDMPEYNFDMVRAGIMLYGLYPSKDVDISRVHLKEVMSLRARLSLVKQIPSGAGVSYGHIYHAASEETIGTLPLGYADGYTRLLTGKSTVLVKGQRFFAVGKICMDQFMIRLPEPNFAKRGDIATLFGEDHGSLISIDEVAQALGTINYEVVCMINKRVPRHYYQGGKLASSKDSVLDF